jgi:hypothetical protein
MTHKNHIFIFLFALTFVFFSCEKKEIEKTATDLKGKYRITEFNYWFKFYNSTKKQNDSIRVQNVFDIKNDMHTLEFFESKNAYTAALKGVYKIEYADLSKTALVDTFSYTLTKDVLSIVDVSTKTTQFTQISGKPRIPNIPLPKRRFKLEEFSGENLFLNGTPYLLNDTCYYKATRLN